MSHMLLLGVGGAVGSLAAPFLLDSFTGTNGTGLAAHSPEVGGTWVKNPASTSTGQISAGAYLSSDTFTATYYNDVDPGTADYTVGGVVIMGNVNNATGVCARLDTAVLTCYFGRYNSGVGNWELAKIVGGAQTILQSAADANSPGAQKSIALTVAGTTQQLVVDGVVVCSANDAVVAGPGRAGVICTKNSTTSTLLTSMFARL